MRLRFVLVGLLAVLGAPGHAQISRVDYARQCAQEIEPLPAFNCMDGTPSGNEVHELQILVDGTPVKAHVTTCDNPIQLELSGNQGQCVPFSRLLKLKSLKPSVIVLALCRKYQDRGATEQQRATNPIFDDIAVVQHDRLTGKTCFFQSTFQDPNDATAQVTHDGRNIPPPTANTIAANRFWAESPEVVSIGCTNCHAADAFYWSPYVAPVLDKLELNPNGRYDSNFANLFRSRATTFKPKLPAAANNGCVTCHRFGRGPSDTTNRCKSFIGKYVDPGRAHAKKPNEIWMPPEFSGARFAWNLEFKASRDQVDRCCDDPSQLECRPEIADGHFPRTEAAEVLRASGSACSETACLGWVALDNDRSTRALAASDATLFQLRENGTILRSSGSPCGGTFCAGGWTMLDRNPLTVAIAAGAGVLHQLRSDGTIWRFSGTPCGVGACPGWVQIGNDARTVAIAMGGIGLQRLDRDGGVWRFVGPACGKNGCNGWQRLDDNPDTVAIVAAPEAIYQLHKSGKIWRYTGKPCNAAGCKGWQMLDDDPAVIAIAAAGSQLYQLRDDGAVLRFNGIACSQGRCPGWRALGANASTVAIAAGGNNVYRLDADGAVFRSTGRPCEEETCPAWTGLDRNDRTTMIVAGGDRLYQLRQDDATARRTELRNRPFGMAATQPR